MSKITNDGLTWSGTGRFIAVTLWQQWASNAADFIEIISQMTSVLAGKITWLT